MMLTTRPENDSAAEGAPHRAAPADGRQKILVVEDDRLSSRILERILTQAGYAVKHAESGETALDLYRGDPCALILLDVMMAGMDGFATCRRFRAEHGDACAPIIFITARASPEDIVQGLEAGAADYLPKPFQAREVVARIRVHLQNQALAAQQQKLVAELSAANAAKNRFLGMAAHDLRNPLVSIRGLAEILEEDQAPKLAPSQLDLVQTIRGASVSMLSLVNELLDLATIEAGVIKLELHRHRLDDILGESVRFQEIQAARKGTRIEFVRGDSPLEVDADAAKLRQVADNLLDNAVKYSPRNSVVEIRLFRGPATAGFVVCDQGPGIPEADRPRLFTDFGRLSAKPTGGESSTGLGLAICRKIVVAHGGSIEARNLPSRGCEFKVSLPLP